MTTTPERGLYPLDRLLKVVGPLAPLSGQDEISMKLVFQSPPGHTVCMRAVGTQLGGFVHRLGDIPGRRVGQRAPQATSTLAISAKAFFPGSCGRATSMDGQPIDLRFAM